MKTKSFFILSIGALLLLSTACSKDNSLEYSTKSFRISASQGQEFKTYFKTQLTDVWWTSGDVLTILPANGAGVVTSNKVDSTTESFDFTVSGWPAGSTPKYAVYNGAEDEVVATISNDVITTTLKDNQTIYHANSFSKNSNLSIGLLQPSNNAYSVTMQNVCGLVQFSIGNYEDITSVTIEDAKGETPLAGTCKIQMINDEPVVTEVSDKKTSITATHKISNDLTFNKGKTYYICVLPGTFTPKFTLTRESGDPIVITGKSPVTVSRAKSKNFGQIDNIKRALKLVSGLYINNETTEGRSYVSGMATASTGSSDPFTIKMADGNSYEFTPIGETAFRLIKDAQADSDSSIKGVICFVKEGYVKLPKVDGYTLTSVYIKTAASDKKAAVTTTCEGKPTLSGAIPLYGEITMTASGKSTDDYYLYCSSSFRIARMTLTYSEN